MNVTVFTKAQCGQCIWTKKRFEKLGVRFDEVRVDQAPEWVDRLRAAGYETAPVVLVGDEDIWGGYSSDSIDEWARELVAA